MSLVTSLVEYHKEREDYRDLASLYARIGNDTLRDKYIGLALNKTDDPLEVVQLHRLQGRLGEVPEKILDAALTRIAKQDWTAQCWLLLELGRDTDAAQIALTKLLKRGIEAGNWFMVAWYMKHMVPVISKRLFALALREAADENDLWWQYRALQELEWHLEAETLLLDNAKEIEKRDDAHLLRELAAARGDREAYREQELRSVRELDEMLDAERKGSAGAAPSDQSDAAADSGPQRAL